MAWHDDKYSMLRDGQWVWIPVSSMETSHVFYAMRVQMSATEELETKLQFLLELEEDTGDKIDRTIKLMGMRHKRFLLLYNEYKTRVSNIAGVDLWLEGKSELKAKRKIYGSNTEARPEQQAGQPSV